jgi:hypothetical protein
MWQPSRDPAKPSGPRDVQQVWFPGVHCDVGGGYPETASGLSKYTLGWMIDEAIAAGLLVDREKAAEVLGRRGSGAYVSASPRAPGHESLKGFWNLAEIVPKRHWNWKAGRWERRMNLYRRRTIPPGSLIHESAYLQGEAYRQRLPADGRQVPIGRPAGIGTAV